jgi:hypothetical protein
MTEQCNTVFPRDMVCPRNICINTLHKGDNGGDDDDDNNNNNNNNNNNYHVSMGQIGLYVQCPSSYSTSI